MLEKQGKARQGKARQDKARQDKTRQGEYCTVSLLLWPRRETSCGIQEYHCSDTR